MWRLGWTLATGVVRVMFDDLGRGAQPQPAPPALMATLRAAISGEVETKAPAAAPAIIAAPAPQAAKADAPGQPDWDAFYKSITQPPPEAPPRDAVDVSHGRRESDDPALDEAPVGRRTTDRVAVARETTIRIDTRAWTRC